MVFGMPDPFSPKRRLNFFVSPVHGFVNIVFIFNDLIFLLNEIFAHRVFGINGFQQIFKFRFAVIIPNLIVFGNLAAVFDVFLCIVENA